MTKWVLILVGIIMIVNKIVHLINLGNQSLCSIESKDLIRLLLIALLYIDGAKDIYIYENTVYENSYGIEV